MKKNAMSLSINTIVILVVALVTLGIILAFVTKIFGGIEFPDPAPIPPTIDNPITFNPPTINRGKNNPMTISIYNNELADIGPEITPSMNCIDIEEVTTKSAGINIAVGEVNHYSTLVKIPKSTPAGEYSCNILISQTEKTFFLTVK